MKKAKVTSKTLEDVEALFLKERGDEFIVRGSDVEPVKRIPTGLYSIDKALGGGIPRGRMTELYGSESSSKTLLALATIAQAQKQGGVCVFIDLEKSFDAEWATKNGVDLQALRIVQPRTGEDAWDVVEKYMATSDVDVIVLDSVASAVPRAELEGDIGQANIGLQARLNAQAMRIITSYFGIGSTKNNRTALMVINQTRANVSTTPFAGSPTTTTGGKSIPFYASLRLELRRMGYVKTGDIAVGAMFRMRAIKAKVTGIKPYATVMFEVDFDTGLDQCKDILNYAILKGWAKKAGSWYTISEEFTEEEIKRQGESAIKEAIIEHGLLDKWRSMLMES